MLVITGKSILIDVKRNETPISEEIFSSMFPKIRSRPRPSLAFRSAKNQLRLVKIGRAENFTSDIGGISPTRSPPNN